MSIDAAPLPSYQSETYSTLEEYYARYPEYINPEDIALYPQLDPSIPTGQIVMGRAAQIGL